MNKKSKSKFISISALIVLASGLFLIPKCFDVKATTPSTEVQQKSQKKVSSFESKKNPSTTSSDLNRSISKEKIAQAKAFNKEAVEKEFYHLVPNGEGKTVPQLLTETELEEMETQTNNTKLSVYQMQIDGHQYTIVRPSSN